MTEITKTTIKRWDAEGKLIEHTETTVEKTTVPDGGIASKETLKKINEPIPYISVIYGCNPIDQPFYDASTTIPPAHSPDIVCQGESVPFTLD